MAKTKTTENASKKRNPFTKNNIMGVVLLFGVLSIGYSTTYIVLGTEGLAPLICVAPQVLLGALIAGYKFCK